MTTQKTVTEEELEEAFRDDPMFGLEVLHAEFRDRIARYIKKHGWDLQPEEIKDLYQETLLEMVQEVRSPGFDPSRPLRLVQTIARRRTIDYLRRKGHRANTNYDAILAYVAGDLGQSDLGLRWRYLDRMIQAEWRQALLEEVARLPERQRIVARAFIDNYEDLSERKTFLPLKEAVAAVTGNDENVVAVKSAWHQAKRTLVSRLTRRGFYFLKEE